MIRLDGSDEQLDAPQRHALLVLLDLSRLLRSDTLDAVPVRIARGATATGIGELRRAGWSIVARDGAVELDAGLLTLVASVVGAVSEQVSSAADKFDRVPPSENVLARDGEERDPLVHRVAVALRDAVVRAAGSRRVALLAPWPEGRRWALAMSHDLDVVSGWPVFTALRMGELLVKGLVGQAARVAAAAVGAAAGTPVWNAVRQVLEVETGLGTRSTWFVITGTPTVSTARAGDITYTPESPGARRIISAIVDAGHELGLHGSFASYLSAATFAQQRERLAAIVGRPIAGVRQHFLRMRPVRTQRLMAQAGFRYDSTFGFSDRNGFRLGVADVVPLWDHSEQRTLDLDEVPFVWMDRALSKYRGIEDPAAWVDDALTIAARCRDAEGVWNGIWHPNLAPAMGYPGAPESFARLVERLMADRPWSASLSDIVAWRRQRRGARAAGITDGGAVVLGGEREPFPLALEDSTGQPIPVVHS
jgi:hypothetical protein